MYGQIFMGTIDVFAPVNDKQKRQAVEEYNWGFYDGFLQGVDDYLEGRRYRFGF